MGSRKSKDISTNDLMIIRDEYGEILKFLVNTLELCNIRYIVSYGTLLNLYRDGDMILGDSDVDLFIDATSITPEFIDAILPNYKMIMHDAFRRPLERCITPRAFEHMKSNDDILLPLKDIIWTFRKPFTNIPKSIYNGIMFFGELCVFYPHHLNDSLIIREYGKTFYETIRKDYLFNTQLLDTKYGKVRIPVNVEQCLEDEYGKGWKTPDPNYKTSLAKKDDLGYIKRKFIGDLYYNPKEKNTRSPISNYYTFIKLMKQDNKALYYKK